MASLSVQDALSTASDSLEVAASLLWQLDTNRLRPGTDYELDWQSRPQGYSHDAAADPLVKNVSDDVWQRPTFAAFKKLLDNYTAETGIPEVVSADERAEEDRFLAAICETPCIQFVYEWLSANSSLEASSMSEFSDMLKRIWFYQYSRDGARDSSGFEHVFCGELDDGKVKGLHNFTQVYVEEGRGNFNYKGYLNVRGEPSYEAPPPHQQMITVRFDWLGKTKPVSSMFVGASPEFEFALFTLLYVAGTEQLELELGPYRVRIKVYQMAGKIGTAFPELLGVDHDKLGQEAIPSTQAVTAPAPTASDFPALGSIPKPPKQAVSYANALLGGDGEEEAPAAEVEEVEVGEIGAILETAAAEEEGEGQTHNYLKWLRLAVNLVRKIKPKKSA